MRGAVSYDRRLRLGRREELGKRSQLVAQKANLLFEFRMFREYCLDSVEDQKHYLD